MALLFVSGIGGVMGGLFDVKHKWHGLAFALGVPSLPIAALLIGYNLTAVEGWGTYSRTILWSPGVKKAGIAMDQNAEPPERVPDGVIALDGYANRLLILCYVGWLIVVAGASLSA